MSKYIVTKSTTAEYLVDDVESASEAQDKVKNNGGKCTGYRELIDVMDAENPRLRSSAGQSGGQVPGRPGAPPIRGGTGRPPATSQ